MLTDSSKDIPDVILSELKKHGSWLEIEPDTTLLRKGQFVKVIPFVIDGLVKVYTELDAKEFLLYYIKPQESCIMSFAAGFKNEPSKVFAISEERSNLLLLPVEKIKYLLSNNQEFSSFFFDQYNKRYVGVLDTLQQIIFNNLDVRVLNYLKKKLELSQSNPLKISHRQIANDLGSSREVISRIVKKLESQNYLIQHKTSIELLEL